MSTPAAPDAPTPNRRRNTWAFALGTLGRDAVYAMVSMFLLVYFTEAVNVSDSTLFALNGILLVIRIIDAFADPIMGAIVDSTRTRWGQFKPWLVGAGLTSALLTVLLFTDLGLSGTPFLVVFALTNLLWGVAWSAHDIPYWSMLPALSLNPAERESMGGAAKVVASIGQFSVIAGFVPAVLGLKAALGSDAAAYQAFAVVVALVMVAFMAITVLFVREPRDLDLTGERTSLRELVRAIVRNDQLLWVALAYLLFMVGYSTTGNFGVYFFKYAYGDESVFAFFALFVGVGQLLGFASARALVGRLGRRRLYTAATLAVLGAYTLFFLSPMNIVPLGIAALVLFFSAAVIQLLMIVFQADTIEYGQLKLGQRNGAVTFAVQPFINKTSSAIATAIVGQTLILSGINSAASASDVTAAGLTTMKVAMMIVPAVLIVTGYLLWRRFFVVDEERHAAIVRELAERGEFTA